MLIESTWYCHSTTVIESESSQSEEITKIIMSNCQPIATTNHDLQFHISTSVERALSLPALEVLLSSFFL